jgi:ribosomal protein S18 acetylase RimI-like enzyme
MTASQPFADETMRPHDAVQFRDQVHGRDVETVREITASAGFFSEAEVDIAVELVQTRLAQGLRSGYYFWFAEQADNVLGYTCFGPIPGTAASYDLYWIAVRQPYRSLGIGSILLQRSEHSIAELGGRRIYVETSSRPLYAPTHAFYRACGYRQAALLEDFYAPGDGKLILVKVLPALVTGPRARERKGS